MNSLWSLLLAAAALALVASISGPAQGAEDTALVTRSLVSTGDASRLQQVLAKAARGEKLVVGVIGGSITAGAKASKPELNYGSLIARWWRETFPTAGIEFVNAGIGATGTSYACLRAERDLLSRRPDFVVTEFAVNDPNTQQAAETYEGLLRQLLALPNQPAVVMMFTMSRGGNNAQEWQSKLGKHYNLPMVSFRDAFWPEIEAGRVKWEDVEADEVHPNDRGHAAMAQFVTALLQQVRQAAPAAAAPAAAPQLPAPLLTDTFANTVLLEAGALKPTRNEGFTYDPAHGWDACYKSDQPGSLLEFEVPGKVLFMMEWHVCGPMGKVSVQVDDRPATTVDAWFEPTWGGWRCTHELVRDLPEGVHKVRLQVLEDKNPQSEGHEFRLMGLGAAGVTP